MSKTLSLLILSAFVGIAGASVEEDDLNLQTLRNNDAVVQNLKTRTINVLGAITEYKDEYFYPAEQRLEIYLTSPARRFTVEHIELRSGDQVLSAKDLSDDSVYAMRLGGSAPLYRGNVPPGRFSLVVVMDGVMSDGRKVTHEASMSLQKTLQPLALELRVKDVPRGSGVGLDAIEQETRP